MSFLRINKWMFDRKMNITKKQFLIGFCLVIILTNIVPLAHSQSQIYQSYFWITDTRNSIDAIRVTGDLEADHVHLSEIVVGGQGNVTLLDGYAGTILANYSISSSFSFNTLAVGNLDTEIDKEIVAGSLDGNVLVVLKYNKTNKTFTKLWGKNYTVTQAQIDDITGDSINEVLIGDTLGNLTVFDKDSNILWTTNLTEPIGIVKCLDFTQDNIIDRILVLTNTFVTILNTSGDIEWQTGLMSKPLDGIIGDVTGDAELELIIKTQIITSCFNKTGGLLWNSSAYNSELPGILLYNSSATPKFDIVISGMNGAYLLNGTDGSLIRSYLSNSSVTSLAIGKIYGEPHNILVMGDANRNITIWNMDPIEETIMLLLNITLSGPVVDVILIDMNADGIPDIVTASSTGEVYVIGVPWFIDLNWVVVGIGIGGAIIIASLFITFKKKSKGAPKTGYPSHIK